MGKIKTEPVDEETLASDAVKPELSYEDKLNFVSVIAKPMASKKLAKKCYKLIKKGIVFYYFILELLREI